MVRKISPAEFSGAGVTMNAMLDKKIRDILKEHDCFLKESGILPVPNRVLQRRKRQQIHNGRAPPPPSSTQTRKSILRSGTAGTEERAIQCYLNKLSEHNFGSIKKSIRFTATLHNVAMIFQKLVERSTSDMAQTHIYVSMIDDLCETLCPEEKDLAVAYLKQDIETALDKLRSNVKFPITDPVNNYDDFCTISKKKRELIGRCNTHMSLMDSAVGIHSDIGDYRKVMYSAHAESLMDFLDPGPDPGDAEYDVDMAVETLLDCLHIIVKNDKSLLGEFQAAAGRDIRDILPNSRCRFKLDAIMELATPANK